MDWSVPLTARQKQLALGLIVAFVLLLLLRLWTSAQAARLHGPMALSVSPDSAQPWVYAAETFYRLSPDGAIQARYPAADFGVRDGITDFQVPGEEQILIGDFGRRQIMRCDLRSADCRPLWPQGDAQLGRPFKFHYDQAHELLFVTDNRAHQLFVHRPGWPAARALTLPGELRHPNAIWMDERQTLWVADTNNHRIVGLRPNGERTKTMYKLEADAEVGSETHPWPVAFARDAQRHFWGLFGDGLLGHAELVRYDRAARAVQRVGFGSGADVVDVVHFDGRVLGADRAGFSLHAVDTEEGAVQAFGAPDWRQEMVELRTASKRYSMLSTLSLLAMLILLVPAFFLARQASRAQTAARQAYLARHGVKVN